MKLKILANETSEDDSTHNVFSAPPGSKFLAAVYYSRGTVVITRGELNSEEITWVAAFFVKPEFSYKESWKNSYQVLRRANNKETVVASQMSEESAKNLVNLLRIYGV